MKPNNGLHLAFPFRIGNNGRAAQVTTLEEHVRDELVQLILTNPAERLFLPEFGGGARRCIGESFAWMELVLVVSAIAQQWRLRAVPGYVPVQQPLVTLRLKNGLPMTVHRRR